MSWYKFAKDFSHRNILNHKIIYLKELKDTLVDLSELVFQSGKTAKEQNYKIVTGKKITSYPILRDMLIEADSIALDSPWRFETLCKEAAKEISGMIITLEEEREQFTTGGEKKTMKGWV